MFEIISKKGLDNLKYYAYAGEDHSLLVKWFLKRFWDWVVTLFPAWVAPNVITLMGFICICINYATMYYYSPNLREPAPAWVYISFAVGIFIYQVLDNIDGKQARRTGSSSPLGELFDHGCDSLFVTISGITICNAIQTDIVQSWWFINIGLFPFYLSHWEEYHSGILIMGQLGNPTEAQLLMIAVHLISAFLTPAFWTQTLSAMTGIVTPFPFINNLTFNWAMMGFAYFVSVGLVVLSNFQVVYDWDRKHKKSFLKSVLMLVPFLTHVLSNYAWVVVLSKAHLLQNNTILTITFYGVVISYMLNRMIVDRITKIEHNPYHPVAFLSTIGLLAAIYGTAEQELTVLYVLFAVLLVFYAHMVLTVIHQLTAHLGINCFSLTAQQKAKLKLK